MIILERLLPNMAIIIEDDVERQILLDELAKDTREGDVLIKINDVYEKDEMATAKRKKEILALQISLWA